MNDSFNDKIIEDRYIKTSFNIYWSQNFEIFFYDNEFDYMNNWNKLMNNELDEDEKRNIFMILIIYFIKRINEIIIFSSWENERMFKKM